MERSTKPKAQQNLPIFTVWDVYGPKEPRQRAWDLRSKLLNSVHHADLRLVVVVVGGIDVAVPEVTDIRAAAPSNCGGDWYLVVSANPHAYLLAKASGI